MEANFSKIGGHIKNLIGPSERPLLRLSNMVRHLYFLLKRWHTICILRYGQFGLQISSQTKHLYFKVFNTFSGGLKYPNVYICVQWNYIKQKISIFSDWLFSIFQLKWICPLLKFTFSLIFVLHHQLSKWRYLSNHCHVLLLPGRVVRGAGQAGLAECRCLSRAGGVARTGWLGVLCCYDWLSLANTETQTGLLTTFSGIG